MFNDFLVARCPPAAPKFEPDVQLRLFRHCALYKQQMSLSLLVTGALASSNNVTYWFGSR